MKRLAVFVTPHGFGHAARSAAVMEALRRRDPELHFEIFTRVPEWFFRATLGSVFTAHPVDVDVGFIQRDALTEDVPATLRELERRIPFAPETVDRLAQTLVERGCSAVLCDIAPLGVAVAHRVGLPCFLQENFTWGWIYAGHFDRYPALRRYAEYLDAWSERATWRIRTEPACDPAVRADLSVPPVARPPRLTRAESRALLNLAPDRPAVLLTMGGMNYPHAFYDRMAARADIQFVIPGESSPREAVSPLLFLPRNSRHYHPDLVMGMDAVLGKAGYSTLAEIRQAGIPYACVLRHGFRESRVLETYVRENLPGFCLEPEAFVTGGWLDRLDELLALPRRPHPGINGADRIAEFVGSKIR